MLFTKKINSVLLLGLIGSAFLVLTYSDIFTKDEAHKFNFTGKEEHAITLAEASELTNNFQRQASPDQIIGGYFGREAILNILAQEGCVGIRYYYGLDNSGVPHIVLVGVNAEGNDMITGILAERAFKCPPFCSELDELNTALISTDYSARF